jgi:hypothetical protein
MGMFMNFPHQSRILGNEDGSRIGAWGKDVREWTVRFSQLMLLVVLLDIGFQLHDHVTYRFILLSE